METSAAADAELQAGLRAAQVDGAPDVCARHFEKALALGLSEEDTIVAYAFLGSAYRQCGDSRKALATYKQAVDLDRQGGYNRLDGALRRMVAGGCARAATVSGMDIVEREGPAAAQAFLLEMLQEAERIGGSDIDDGCLIHLLFELGVAQEAAGDREGARASFVRAALAPVDPGEPEERIKHDAFARAKRLAESRCFIATAALGSADAPELLALRRFRDCTLLRSRLGRVSVAMYEWASPPLAEQLRRSAIARAAVRSVLIRPLVRLITLGFER